MLVSESELERLNSLEPAWAAFLVKMPKAASQLEHAKTSFREHLVAAVARFSTEVTTSHEAFVASAPYSTEVSELHGLGSFLIIGYFVCYTY